MEELIIENMKEDLVQMPDGKTSAQMAKHIFKIGDFNIFFKLCKTDFSTQFVWQRIPRNTFYEI